MQRTWLKNQDTPYNTVGQPVIGSSYFLECLSAKSSGKRVLKSNLTIGPYIQLLYLYVPSSTVDLLFQPEANRHRVSYPISFASRSPRFNKGAFLHLCPHWALGFGKWVSTTIWAFHRHSCSTYRPSQIDVCDVWIRRIRASFSSCFIRAKTRKLGYVYFPLISDASGITGCRIRLRDLDRF